MKKTVQSGLTPQVRPVAYTEGVDTDMNTDVPHHLSPVADENVAGMCSQEQLQISQKVFTIL
jgi:hypothetical protein